MTKRRFMSRGAGWSNGIVELDREGREFDTESEADLIASILRDAVGGLVIEAPSLASQKEALVDLWQDDFHHAVEREVEKRLTKAGMPAQPEEKKRNAQAGRKRKSVMQEQETAVTE